MKNFIDTFKILGYGLIITIIVSILSFFDFCVIKTILDVITATITMASFVFLIELFYLIKGKINAK